MKTSWGWHSNDNDQSNTLDDQQMNNSSDSPWGSVSNNNRWGPYIPGLPMLKDSKANEDGDSQPDSTQLEPASSTPTGVEVNDFCPSGDATCPTQSQEVSSGLTVTDTMPQNAGNVPETHEASSGSSVPFTPVLTVSTEPGQSIPKTPTELRQSIPKTPTEFKSPQTSEDVPGEAANTIAPSNTSHAPGITHETFAEQEVHMVPFTPAAHAATAAATEAVSEMSNAHLDLPNGEWVQALQTLPLPKAAALQMPSHKESMSCITTKCLMGRICAMKPAGNPNAPPKPHRRAELPKPLRRQ